MTWRLLLKIITDEAGKEIAARIEERAKRELGGIRVTVYKKPVLTVEKINEAAAGNVKKAAKVLGVHPTTIYRALNRNRFVR